MKSYEDANHRPQAVVQGGVDRTVSPGETVTLSAEGTTDPDGDALSYRWWQYADADTATSTVSIDNATAKDGASFTVPDEPGKTVHVILEVSDNGTPTLRHYQRVIFQIR